MKLFYNIKHSFSARFSLYILILVGVVFLATLSITYINSYRTIENAARENAEITMEKTTLEIESLLSGLSKTVDNVARILQKEPFHPDSLYSIVREIVENNSDVIGSAIAFEPDHFRQKGYYYSPYAYREGDKVSVKQLGTVDYDYFTKEWYQIPKLLDRNYWTEPYYDEGGGEAVMCTYSSIMKDENGNFMGVVTVDISLDWLSNLVQSIKPYPNSYSFLIGCGGTYIVHRQKNRILNESIFSISYEEPDPSISQRIGQKMVDGETGEEIVMNDDYLAYIFYAPIENIGWSLAMVCPADDIFAELTRTSRTIGLYSIGGLLLIFVFCLIAIRRVTSPLKSFAVSAKKIAHGDFNVALPVIKSEDEMMELRNSFDYLQKELVRYMDSLQNTASAKEKIESELRIARQIQLGMIPKTFPAFPTRTDMDIYAILNPAKEVGGDLYDFYIDGDRLLFVIGDVSGKGVPASLLMAVTRSMFRSASAYLHSPAEIVSALSAAIVDSNDSNMFVTLFLGILNLKTGEINYCNAGHNPPVLLSSGNVGFFPVEPNIPLGLFEGFEYKEQNGVIPNGATLFCYTDGLTEAESETKELYGEDRLLKVLEDKELYTSKNQINAVYEDVRAHVGNADQSDDLTMLSITVFYKTISRKIVITNDLSEIETLKSTVDSFCEEVKISPELSMQLQLVLEEAVTNVILYAYPDKKGDIELELSQCNGHLTFVLSDRGIPYNPLEKEDPDVTLAAEERPIGGLGIYFIKQLMDEVGYNRNDGKNIFTMKKIQNN
ncbi:MAG: SpoIIE family protein phosphatase [Bacteroidales bacterium]|nr:SpoIIE family protein phosphatase [Bacteroidales bacterium]MDD4669827.1 SpoIIE family protein phosphatase [Bacteroidales bacterium]